MYEIQQMKADNIDDFMVMWENKEKRRIWSSIFMVYESIGVLVHEGLIDIRIVARYIGFFRFEWDRWGPLIKQARELRKRPRMYIESEYLYERLIEFGKQNLGYGIV